MLDHPKDNKSRKSWLSLLASAPEGRACDLLDELEIARSFDWLRAPEIGSVMVQGRAGGTGEAFHLGEVTVTRCSLKLASGEVGHGYVQGRRKDDAECAAMIDALMQTSYASRIQESVLDVLRDEQLTKRRERAAKAAATKVDFFTMVRGEDK